MNSRVLEDESTGPVFSARSKEKIELPCTSRRARPHLPPGPFPPPKGNGRTFSS